MARTKAQKRADKKVLKKYMNNFLWQFVKMLKSMLILFAIMLLASVKASITSYIAPSLKLCKVTVTTLPNFLKKSALTNTSVLLNLNQGEIIPAHKLKGTIAKKLTKRFEYISVGILKSMPMLYVSMPPITTKVLISLRVELLSKL